MELGDSTHSVLRVLARGRSNTHHLCQQSGLGEAAVRDAVETLIARGFAAEVDRGLYAITSDGLDALDRPYPDEAGFLKEASVIHDAPEIKTLRLRGDRGLLEVQVDDESAVTLADVVATVLADAHGDHAAAAELERLVEDRG